jgi:hypothetical protein
VGSAPSGYAIRQGKNVKSVTIDGSLLDAINALPDRAHCAPGGGYPWDTEKDDALLAGWNKKPQALICKLLKCSERTARKRYRELTKTG